MITKSIRSIILSALFLLLSFVLWEQCGYARTYYVATDGYDGNTGTTLFSPFKTIQKALDSVQPGDECLIKGGTYYGSLVLKKSGTDQARITVKNYEGESVTVNSGGSRTLTVYSRVGYYTIEGISFIATYGSGDQLEASLNLQGGWVGERDKEGGNDGFILRNCYVQGAVRFYGQHNLMENCEVYGNEKKFVTGVADWWGPSHHNTYRNNLIHSFSGRGFWSMSYTENIVLENNKVYDCSHMGIDLDGATAAVRNCIVKGNQIYNIIGQQGVGILMENAMDCVIDGNIIHDVGHEGIQLFNYGLGCGHQAIEEYRDDYTNTILTNNVIYNVYGGDKGGINGYAIRGIKVIGNTIHNARGAGILLNEYCGWQPRDWVIKNNILSDNDQTIRQNGGASGLDIANNLYYHSSSQVYSPGTSPVVANPQYVDANKRDFHLQASSPAIDAGVALSDYSADFEGTSRPQGKGYDIGAFEYKGEGTGPSLPDAPVNLRVIE